MYPFTATPFTATPFTATPFHSHASHIHATHICRWEQMSPRVYRNLDEIFAGEYEGKTYEEIKEVAPSEAILRSMDKIGYRCASRRNLRSNG